MAPQAGLLWTPGYWGWRDGFYAFNQGYWGPTVGYYGGINYGFGYGGSGFDGGHWQGRDFYYNRAVTRLSGNTTNVYNQTVVVNNTHISYNGGAGGVRYAPNPREQMAAREAHVQLTPEQNQHARLASQNQQLLASVNHGKPPVAATGKSGDFTPKRSMPATAAGGHVDENALRATPRAMPPARSGPSGPARPAPQPGQRSTAAGSLEPQQHPAPVPGAHPVPEPQPGQQHPAPAPAPGPRPVPAPQPGQQHPAPAPVPGPRPVPEPQPGQQRPAPSPQPGPHLRPVPVSRPSPQQRPGPAPQHPGAPSRPPARILPPPVPK
jgi:hypothetical protein